MVKRLCLVLCLLSVAVLVPLAISCETSSDELPSDHLIITMSFDNDPKGYYVGDQVDIYFLEDNEFRLSDVYGTFYGDYNWSSDSNYLTLDFDEYSTLNLTLDPDGSFSGNEADYSNGGSYQW